MEQPRGRTLAIGPLWAAASFVLFVAALFGAIGVIAAVRVLIPLGHDAEVAVLSVAWGINSLVGVLLAARLVVGRWLAVPFGAIAIAGIGIGLSATVHVVLQQWARERFGYYDPELVWWTAGLFTVLIGLATSAFGAYLAPRELVMWPLLGVALGGTGILLIVLTNVAGTMDGIEPGSWPLAVWVGLSGLYAAVLLLGMPERLRHGGR